MNGSQSTGLKPRTVRYIHTIIHAALDDAVKWRRVPLNAADQATPPSVKLAKAPEMKVWSAVELSTFLNLNEGDRYQPPWLFLATTGCRRGEMLGLRWQDVDLDEGLVSIRQQVIPLTKVTGKGREGRVVARTKNGDARVIELDRRTVTMLRSWKARQAEEKLLLGVAYKTTGSCSPAPTGCPSTRRPSRRPSTGASGSRGSSRYRSSACTISAIPGRPLHQFQGRDRRQGRERAAWPFERRHHLVDLPARGQGHAGRGGRAGFGPDLWCRRLTTERAVRSTLVGKEEP